MNAGEAARQVRIDQAQDDVIKTAQHDYRDDGGAQERRRTQRHCRMIEHGGVFLVVQAVDVEFALAGHARIAVVGNAGLIETQARDHAAQIRMRRSDGRQGLDDFSVDETKFPFVARDGVLTDFVDDPIALATEVVEERPFRALFTYAGDHVIALPPQLEVRLQPLRRVLQLGVYLHHRVPPRVQVVREYRALEAVVLGKTYRPDARVLCGQFDERLPCI